MNTEKKKETQTSKTITFFFCSYSLCTGAVLQPQKIPLKIRQIHFSNLKSPIPNSSIAMILTFLLFIFFAPPLMAAASDPSTIYDHLRLHGLPIGLLPKNITRFSIESSTGRFQVFLDQPCNAKFENEVHYDFNVSGRLSYGQIAELAGISSQELFLWFPVKGIRVDLSSSGVIHFDVGVVDKQFSLSLFESPPDCTAADPVDALSGASVDLDGVLSMNKAKKNLQHEDGELRATS